MPLVKYVISTAASPSKSLCTFQYKVSGRSCGNVVSSTSKLPGKLVRNLQLDGCRIDPAVYWPRKTGADWIPS